MRRNPTEWEKRLWRGLSNRQLAGFKFRRQAIIGNRIVDFFCPAIGLIVEVDGDTHDPERDRIRDKTLESHDLTVFCISNADVRENQEGVLAAILIAAQNCKVRTRWRLPPPQPSFGPVMPPA